MREIPLTQGKFALIDDEDFNILSVWKWHLNNGYASSTASAAEQRSAGSGKVIRISMHRVLAGLSYDDVRVVDHIDGNKLNNQRANLRVCSNSQNLQNRGAQANNSSGFKGVTWNKRDRRWHARISVGPKNKHLGTFRSAAEAGEAYRAAALLFHGEFAYQR